MLVQLHGLPRDGRRTRTLEPLQAQEHGHCQYRYGQAYSGTWLPDKHVQLAQTVSGGHRAGDGTPTMQDHWRAGIAWLKANLPPRRKVLIRHT